MKSMMFFSLIFLLVGNNTGDLLDYTPTQAYWQMRDQRIVDAQTMSAVLADNDAGATDKLMAIRALGELGKAEGADEAMKAQALKLLTPLTQSNEPFVGQYARRSIAWVKGADPEPRPALPAEVYDLDLALLPADSAFVGQLRVANGIGPVELASLIPDIQIEGQSMRDQMIQQLMPMVLEAVKQVGNVRLDLVTASMTVKGNDPSFTVVVRGQYDRVAALIAMENVIGEEENWSFFSIGDIEVVANTQGREQGAVLMPSNELFVFVSSDRANQADGALPIEAIARQLQQGGGKPALSDVLTKQIAAIDRDKADLWLAMQATQEMKQEREFAEVFGAFDAGRAFATRDAEGLLDIQWVAEGSDAAAVGQTAAMFTEQINQGVAEISREKQRMPAEMHAMMDPMLKIMESMKFNHEGKTMTGGMKVQSNVGTMMPWMMMGMRVDRPRAAAEAVEVLPAEVDE